MTGATARRSGALLLAVAPLVLGTAVVTASGADLTRDTAFTVTAPLDGTRVSGPVTVAWTAARGASSYAVVVDRPLPHPGGRVSPGPQVLVLTGRQLSLELGAARSGSPSARTANTVSVLPLDSDGRRAGEDVAVVHVRASR